MFNADFGLLTTGTFNGQVVAVVYNLATGTLAVDYVAQASTDSSTMLLPVLASQHGNHARESALHVSRDRLRLLRRWRRRGARHGIVQCLHECDQHRSVRGVAPNATVSVPVAINPAEAAITPPLGYMIVTQDNKNGAHRGEADSNEVLISRLGCR